eukprot:177298_1
MNAQKIYNLIDDLKKDISNVRLPSSTNWNQNLTTILTQIPKKFADISNMKETESMITMNNKIIDKNDSRAFDELLSSTPPATVIQIKENFIVIYIHYKDKIFNYHLKTNMN